MRSGEGADALSGGVSGALVVAPDLGIDGSGGMGGDGGSAGGGGITGVG